MATHLIENRWEEIELTLSPQGGLVPPSSYIQQGSSSSFRFPADSGASTSGSYRDKQKNKNTKRKANPCNDDLNDTL